MEWLVKGEGRGTGKAVHPRRNRGNQETPQGTCRGRKRKEGRGRRGRKEPLNMG